MGTTDQGNGGASRLTGAVRENASSCLRQKIVAFVRALIVATKQLQRDPQESCLLLAQAAELDIESVRNSWPYLTYPGTLATDLLDVLVPADAWVAKETRRAPRTRSELSKFMDGSVLREALV